MAQNEWFVINGVHHQGPFALSKLKQMAMENDFSKEHRFWKPGMKESVTRAQFFQDYLGIGLPEIPNAKPKIIEEVSFQNAKEVDFNLGDFFDSSNNEISEVSEVSLATDPSVSETDTPVFMEMPKPKVFQWQKFLKGTLSFVALIALCVIGYYSYLFFKPGLERPKGIRNDDYARLMKCYQKKGQACFEMAFSKDYGAIWMLTNSSIKRSLTLSLKSKAGKNLSLKDTMVQSSQTSLDRSYLFDVLEFEEGGNLVPGYYDVEIKQGDKNIYAKKDLYLGHLNEQTFKKKLKEVREKLLGKVIRPWRELEEKYQTLAALLINIRSELKTALYENQFKTSSARASYFDKAYRNKYGNMFTVFVLTNDDSKEVEKNKPQVYKKDVLTFYSELELLAKSLGKITVESINELKKTKVKLVKKKKEMMLSKYQDLQGLIINKKRVISAKISSLKQL